jgi:D-inositol-3-phosphate glycosyltransferase
MTSRQHPDGGDMKVVLLSTSQPSVQQKELYVALRNAGIDARMYAPNLERGDVPAATVANQLGARVRALTADWRPDVLHATDTLAGVAAHIVSARRAAVVQGVNGFSALERRGSVRPAQPSRSMVLEARLLRRASIVAASCTEQAMELFRLRVPTEHVRVVEAAIDPDPFDIVAHVGAFPYPLHVLHPGGTDPSSGVIDAIQALVLVPQAHLTVAGGTQSGADDVLAIARRLHVGHRVSWVGAVRPRAMAALYQAHHVVVSTPWRCWDSRIALEAVASRRPLVASATGAMLDGLGNGSGVPLVPINDPVAIGTALTRLLKFDPVKRVKRLERTRETVLQSRTWTSRAPGWVGVYESAMDNRRLGAELALGVA